MLITLSYLFALKLCRNHSCPSNLGGVIFSQVTTGSTQQVVHLIVWCHVTIGFGTFFFFFRNFVL